METTTEPTNDELRAQVEEKNRIMREGTRKQKRKLIAQDVVQLIDNNYIKPEHTGFVRFATDVTLKIGEDAAKAARGANYPYEPVRLDPKEIAQLFERIEILEGCEVCALGACTVSAIRLFNKFSPQLSAGGTVFEAGPQHGTPSAEQGHLIGYLQEFFELKQMAMIEAAYERGSGFFGSDHPIVAQDADNEEGDSFETEMEVECNQSECAEPTHTVTVYHRSEERSTNPEWWREAVAFGRRHNDSAMRLMAIMQNVLDNDGEFVPDVTSYELERSDLRDN